VICIDARHAKAVLKMQINKSDRNDAAGIARIMQTGWFKEVRVKDLDNHAVKALLASRALLVKIKRDLDQVRGLLKNVGLVISVKCNSTISALMPGLPRNLLLSCTCGANKFLGCSRDQSDILETSDPAPFDLVFPELPVRATRRVVRYRSRPRCEYIEQLAAENVFAIAC